MYLACERVLPALLSRRLHQFLPRQRLLPRFGSGPGLPSLLAVLLLVVRSHTLGSVILLERSPIVPFLKPPDGALAQSAPAHSNSGCEALRALLRLCCGSAAAPRCLPVFPSSLLFTSHAGLFVVAGTFLTRCSLRACHLLVFLPGMLFPEVVRGSLRGSQAPLIRFVHCCITRT